MADHRKTSMNHVGMNRESIKEAVKSRLIIGQQYCFQSGRDNAEEKRSKNFSSAELTAFSKNAAVFEQSDGRIETLTYQEIWKMLLEGSFK